MTTRRRSHAEETLALAHALRTPLTSLNLGLGLLHEGALGPLTEAQRDVVETLVVEAARLALLVDRELPLDRLGAHAGPVDRVGTDLAALVDRARRPLEAQAEERAVTIACALEEGVIAVVDPVKMGWVVASLIGNALRYSPRGATVRVRLARTAEGALLEVADEGPGLDPAVAAGLFERGGGLGLFLVREIVDAHGGAVEVSSEPGRGARFVVKLTAPDGGSKGAT